MVEFASAIIGPIFECLIVPVKKHLGYLFLSRKHVTDLGDGMKQLEGESVDVENHQDRNNINTLEIPARVPGWLKEVAKIKRDAETISRNEYRCFNMKARYQMGRNAWKTTQEIERLLQERREISWTDAQKPLGRVYTRRASTPAPSSGGIGDDFKSRDTTFKDALKFLQQDQNIQVIALCGMGGVGKTMMMEQLKKVVEDKKMFHWIVKVVIGKEPNPLSIQQAVAENLGDPLIETTKATRADRLQMKFVEILKKAENGILVILDDIWEKVELKDVGLSPLPNGVKLLLTSRYEDICKSVAIESNLDLIILKVNVLEEIEAHKLLCQITGISKVYDPELYQIGGEIVKKCSCLPLAIKLIAATLTSEEKSIWKDRLRCLKKHDLDPSVHEIIKISYDYLKEEEDKEIFLLCGLFPEDANIPIEDLTRYAWGLKLLNGVSTVEDGRNRIKACVRNLKKANLLIDSDYFGCVKMHDLVLAFVLATVSKGDHVSIINHGDMSKWSGVDLSESCKRISLTCRGMCEFPKGFKCQSISLLKLMHGDDSFEFPQGFYENTKNLKVIAYEEMQYPPLPKSLQCSTNLRTLCLHECSFMFDCSSIGDLLNLEVLSFANCGIRELPSTIGKLKKLKLLDLTGCIDLHIDDGVLKNLVKLEELYMKVASTLQKSKLDKKAIRFTDANVDELVWCSKNLIALEIEFQAPLKNMSFTKLERFKICLGCYLREYEDQNKYLFGNTLRLVISSCPDLETLVDGENSGVEVIKFEALKFLSLRGLPKLKSFCNAVDVIELPQLRDLKLKGLAKFTSIYPINKLATTCMSGDPSERQSLFKEKVMIPRLEKLDIDDMENLIEIWPSSEEVDVCMLREIRVMGCDSLVNLFPSNPMSLLHYLQEVTVEDCDSLEVLFNIDFGCVGKIEEVSSCLRTILVCGLRKLREVVRVKGANNSSLIIGGFETLERLKIERCKRFRNVFTPTTTNIDMRALSLLEIDCRKSWRGEINVTSNEEISEVGDAVVFSSKVIHTFHHIRTLHIRHHKRAEGVFEIETPSNREIATTLHNTQRSLLLPYLTDLELSYMECMSHVWRCNWNKFLIPQKQQPEGSSSFHNLANISLHGCNSIKYLFSPLMAKLLSNLKHISISYCDVIEEVVSNRDDEDEVRVVSTSANTSNGFFPHLHKLYLSNLPKLMRVGGGGGSNAIFSNTTTNTSIHHQFKLSQVNDVAWSLCQYFRKIRIHDCQALPYVIPSCVLGQMQKLEKLKIEDCESLAEVFETQGFKINGTSGGTDHNTLVIPTRKNINASQLSTLKKLVIKGCDLLKHVLTCSTLESITQLEKLRIISCKALEVIVKEDNEEQTTISSKVVVFPRIKFIQLRDLPNLTGFFLGKNEFEWPLLDNVMIDACPQMTVFTSGLSITPKLNYIHTEFGKYSLECGLNFPVMGSTLHEIPCSSLDNTNSCATTSEGTRWSFHNLIEIDASENNDVKTIIPSNELSQLQKLEKIRLYDCDLVVNVFEALEGTSSSESQSVVEIPKLTEVDLDCLDRLEYIWKNNPWMVLKFPNLTKLCIRGCESLRHVFGSSMVGSLLQLQEIHISYCKNMEVIVKEEEEERDGKVNEIITMLPQLKSLILIKLPSLKGCYLGNEALSWPSLDTLEIKCCPSIEVFTKAHSATPELQVIDTSFGRCELVKEEGLNSFIINTKQQQGLQF
ncbi:Disease resistance protein [Cynara cardunculus var. scolymus]|uniref:Disease resistance protein n=1 Tax=Cynara cardunculus var. scolymus TaxID=59895 RepID=A0A103XZK0_CYNCS|nr:Disease resistance protein [Cynara cardunculus var. scolymus]